MAEANALSSCAQPWSGLKDLPLKCHNYLQAGGLEAPFYKQRIWVSWKYMDLPSGPEVGAMLGGLMPA